MISFVKKPEIVNTTDTPPMTREVEENSFGQIRKEAAERHRRADTDGTRRRARQTAEDNRLI